MLHHMDSFSPLQPPLLLGAEAEVVTGADAVPFALPTGTVTFLLTDVEGSTKLWERDAAAMAVAIAAHYEILERAIAASGGVRPVEQGEGDSVVGAFSRATDCVAAAAMAQRLLAAEQWPDGVVVRVRMAIHTGEAQLRDEGNYFGQAIIRCARLRSCGVGGQVLLSQTAADLVSDRLPADVSLVDLGRHRLKDLQQPEQVWQLAIDDLPNDFPPLSSLDSFRHNLPARVTPLIGREVELAELATTLTGERILTLTGSGGCGKTRLASELAARVIERFAGGVSWVELAPRTADEAVAEAIAAVTDVVPVVSESLIASVIRSLRGREPTLLILDNAEHLLAATADAVSGLIDGVAQLTIVCTSREPLGVPGEVVWRVPSLAAPRLDRTAPIAPAALSQFDAVQLFIDRAGRARRGFTVTDANAPAVAQICSRLDGVPLAIELAAARVRSMPPERIAAQLDDRFRLLAGGPRTLLARQQTLQASVAWSEELLDESERAVFRRLGVFVGGLTIDAAEGLVAVFGDVDAYEVSNIVGRLVDKSLLVLDEQHDRYSMLETIRSYALQRLLETGETAAARDAHAGWFADWLDSLGQSETVTGVNDWWTARERVHAHVDNERANCVGALEWLQPGDSTCLRILAVLGEYWVVRRGEAESARVGMPPLLNGDRASQSWLTAVVAMQGPRTNALDQQYEELCAEAIQLADELNDRVASIRLNGHRALIEQVYHGPTASILAELEQTRVAAVEAGEWDTLWTATQAPAIHLAFAGRLAEAQALSANLAISRMVLMLAGCATLRGDADTASMLIDRAEVMIRDGSGPHSDSAVVQLRRVQLALATCDPALLDRAGSRYVFAGQPIAAVLDYLPTFFDMLQHLAHGRLHDARTAFSTMPTEIFGSWRAIAYVAQIDMALGDPVSARAEAERLRDLCGGVSAPAYETVADLVLAECTRPDDLAAALDLVHEALATAAEFELWPNVVDALEAIGSMLVDGGRTRDAARLLAAAQTGRDAMRYRYRFAHRAAYVAEAHLVAGADDGWAEGAILTLPEAVELAQRMRGDRVRPSLGWDSLTPTETQVVEQVALGLTNQQVAEKLLMSRATVKTHLVHVFTKLALTNRAELTAVAVRRSTDNNETRP